MKIYAGPKNSCAMCERHFKLGEAVHYSAKENLLFCYPRADEADYMQRCSLRWVLENGKPLNAEPVEYRGKS